MFFCSLLLAAVTTCTDCFPLGKLEPKQSVPREWSPTTCPDYVSPMKYKEINTLDRAESLLDISTFLDPDFDIFEANIDYLNANVMRDGRHPISEKIVSLVEQKITI